MDSVVNVILKCLLWLFLEIMIPGAKADTKFIYIPGNGSNCMPTHVPVNAVVVQNSDFNGTGLVSDCQITFEVDDIKPHDLYFDYNSFMAHVSIGVMQDCAKTSVQIFTTMLHDHGAYQSFSWSDNPVVVIDCESDESYNQTIISGPYIRIIFQTESVGSLESQDFDFSITITKVKQEKFCRWKDYICSDGNCIDSSNRCDGINHCPNGEDEQGCSNFFIKWWYIVVNYFTKRSFNTFGIVMILIIVLAILLGLYNQRRVLRNCFYRVMGKTGPNSAEGSQTPLQQVNTHTPPHYQGHSGSYLDQHQEYGYPMDHQPGHAGYLPVSQKADGAQSLSGYTYNTESAYTVKF